MSKPILFYSKNSSECVNLWKFLDSKQRLDEFVKVCVDGNPRIPKSITSVPSIFIKNRPLIYGQAIKMYLDSPTPIQNRPVFKENNKKMDNNSVNKNQFDKPPDIETSTNNLGGIADFNAIEMGSTYSDKYSFIQDNPAPMNNQYQFIDDLRNNSITGHVEKNSMGKKNDLNNKLEELQRNRATM